MRKLKPKKKGGPVEAGEKVTEKQEREERPAAVIREERKDDKTPVRKKTPPEAAGEGLVAGWTQKVPWINQVKSFLREVKMEMKKVTWPTRKETLAATAMVIVLSVLVAFFLGILDVALAKLVSSVLGR